MAPRDSTVEGNDSVLESPVALQEKEHHVPQSHRPSAAVWDLTNVNLESEDYYENLGLPKSASMDQVRHHYHRLAFMYHPDRNSVDGREEAERKFKIVGQAYSVLSDGKRRATYDKYGKEAVIQETGVMTMERAAKEFAEFYNYGNMMDPDHPIMAQGALRATAGIVYAPVKGLCYGGYTLATGLVGGATHLVSGVGSGFSNVGKGFKEMGQAMSHKKGSRRSNDSRGSASLGSLGSEVESSSSTGSSSNRSSLRTHSMPDLHAQPTFKKGLKRATVDFARSSFDGVVGGAGYMLAGGAAAVGYGVGGLVGSGANVASGIKEMSAAHKQKRSKQHNSAAGNRRATTYPVQS